MTSTDTDLRYPVDKLTSWTANAFMQAGMEEKKAACVAEILVEGDLLGHSTHGLQLLPTYLENLANDSMLKDGEPELIADQGATIAWNGKYLPGPWLVVKAMELAFERIASHPVLTMTIQKSHHIACLAAYPKLATDKNLMMLLTCNDPSMRSVAPYGGLEALYTPNPIAGGIPTSKDPIIFDISMSTAANGIIAKAHRENRLLPGNWLLDHQGNATNDPATFFSNNPGTVLPLGGMDLGYKGFALGILVEALTAGMSGHGRSDQPTEWGASVFMQLINPAALGGTAHFLKEMDWLAAASRSNPVKPGNPPVRLPGQRGLELKREQLEKGVALGEQLVQALKEIAAQTGNDFPDPI